MRVRLAVVAKEEVKALLVGDTLGQGPAQAPLAHESRLVARVLEHAAEGAVYLVLDPRVPNPNDSTIRDRFEHLARMFSLEPIYRHLAGRPLKGDSFAERIMEDLAATVTATNGAGSVQATTIVEVAHAVVEVINFAFAPDPVTIPAGGDVLWVPPARTSTRAGTTLKSSR